MQIKNSGRLISHGICKACSDDLFNNEGKIEETARELKPVMEMIEAAAFNPSPKSIEKYFNGMDSAIKSRNDIHI